MIDVQSTLKCIEQAQSRQVGIKENTVTLLTLIKGKGGIHLLQQENVRLYCFHCVKYRSSRCLSPLTRRTATLELRVLLNTYIC